MSMSRMRTMPRETFACLFFFTSFLIEVRRFSSPKAASEEFGPQHLRGQNFRPHNNFISSQIFHGNLQFTRWDFVVLGLGRFSGIPNIPSFPPGKRPETFHGEVIHSMDYAAMDYKLAAKCIKGKRIVVVVLQKSALDIAMECSTANGVELPCTVLYKSERWGVPNYLPWGVPLAYLYLNRFSELLVHKPGEGFLLSSLATILSRLRWVFSKFVESYIKWKLPLAKLGMVPKHSFHKEFSSCLTSTVPKNFYDRVEEGSILPKKTQNISFCEEGIMVDDEDSPLKTDLVILATGFRGDKKLRDIFASPTFQDCMAGSPEARVPLYSLRILTSYIFKP
ncbi:Flavin-dependent monooxygenase 1 [Theobroma cacao]|uniref:Flavin-containing monooxygenase n=1 Tax=Theobroma cacao TaxID=3641 RepID=A0A061DYH5_THECC|nr:Flavin-dependent monooxygenase 1 [Theobroma cacao]